MVGEMYVPHMASISDRLVCPTCNQPLSSELAYSIHIELRPINCASCECRITPENLIVATFIKNYQEGAMKPYMTFAPDFGTINTWKSVIETMGAGIKTFVTDITTVRATRISYARGIRSYFDALIVKAKSVGLTHLSMDLVKGMYVQLDFVNKICSNYDYWSETSVLRGSIARYEKFMTLMRVMKHKGKDVGSNPRYRLSLACSPN